MQVVTATDVKNQLGDLFDALEKDEACTVLIERSRRPVAMLLNAQIAEKIILGAYAQGVLPRSVAMQQLGVAWFGDLVQRMDALGIQRPRAAPEDAAHMTATVDEVFRGIDSASPSAPKSAAKRKAR